MLIVLAVAPQISAHENSTHEDLILQTDDLNNVSIDDSDVLSSDLKGATYYFNSSSDVDGDGSKDNPYNHIDYSRFQVSSTLYLADGEYNFSQNKYVNGINLIGQNVDKTILRYAGPDKTGILFIDPGKTFIVENVTLIGFNIDVEGGTFYAKNTVIRDATAIPTYTEATDLVNSASNSFGGAIKAYKSESNSPLISLENCTLVNNTGEYGGAIHSTGGRLIIKRSNFFNNYAYNYGGAIVALYGCSVEIENSNFTNDYSINDAGGAFYLLKSQLKASNLYVSNSSSTFGAAITALDSNIALTHFTAENNTAKYEGGAVYALYNSVSFIDSVFRDNHARNGGAIFADELKFFELENNQFLRNTASQFGGAVHSMMNSIDKIFYNIYEGNHAPVENDFFETNVTMVTLNDAEYTMVYKDYEYYGFIPTSYDLREFGMVTPVKDQQSGGNCWAFASIAALESAILKASGMKLDLSEENMKNIMQKYSDYGWSTIETNNGGYDDMALGYLVNWIGPVLEGIDNYDDYSMLSPLLDPITHVQNILYIKREGYTDNNAIKEAVRKYGAVSTGIFFSGYYFNDVTNGYYCPMPTYANHGVAIVGWDDSYSKDNFFAVPEGDGAWIVKNSWNTDWGDNGYFYVSYYDKVFAEVGIPDATYAFVFNDSAKYEKNYQYDLIGKTNYFATGKNTVWVENIFNATGYDMLAGVSSYFRKPTDYTLFIFVNDELKLTKTGKCDPGYITINLGDYIPLQPNDTFKVRFKLDAKDGAEFAVSEWEIASKKDNTTGVSFFSKDGVEWIDLYGYAYTSYLDNGHQFNSQVACIKAFTISYELQHFVDLNVENEFNKVNISAMVYDQFDNPVKSGKLTLNIGGIDYFADIENGNATFTHIFESKGEFDINASYRNGHSNYVVEVTVIDADIEVEVLKDGNNVIINFESPFDINSSLNVTINGNDNRTIDFENGRASLTLMDLPYGSYTLNCRLVDEYYGSFFNSNFVVLVNKTKMIADDLLSYSESEAVYSVILRDVNGNSIANRQVFFIINGIQYIGVTNWDGKATITAKLPGFGSYDVMVNFYGDESYLDISDKRTIQLISSIITSSSINGNEFEAVLLNGLGAPLVNADVEVNVGEVKYSTKTDSFGRISLKLSDIKSDKNYEVKIANPSTGETLQRNMKVAQVISENKDVVMYYGDGSAYKVKVSNGKGEIVKFMVGKSVYYAETDNLGYALAKFNLKPGSYKVTATYKGISVSNNLVIKKVLFTKNISKKKSKKIKFKATLKQGKKALSHKKIIFRINGKVFAAKTNNRGVATVTLKNLKVGKHKIFSIYRGLKVKNTIKIKK